MAVAINLDRKERASDPENAAQEDFATGTLRKVVRDGWRRGLQEHQKSNGTVEAIELHAGRMGRMFDTTEYEAYCVPNILEHMKYMSLVEARSYMSALERLGGVYKQMYGSELAGLLMIGVSKKAKDVGAVARNLDSITGAIKARIARHEKLSNSKAMSLRSLSSRRYVAGKSILGRLFGKREIALLDIAIAERKMGIRKHSRRIAKYSGMLNGSAKR